MPFEPGPVTAASSGEAAAVDLDELRRRAVDELAPALSEEARRRATRRPLRVG